MEKLKFSPANAKLQALRNVESVSGFLKNKRKVYSFDILSGINCPYAKDCESRAVESPDGKRSVQDGKYTKFRCFSATQEVIFPLVYRNRKHNGDTILKAAAESVRATADLILGNLPSNAGIVRIHVGGDFKTRNYFRAWAEVAKARPDVLFYAYTKSLPFAWEHFSGQPLELWNFRLTASRGGHRDDYIGIYNLREAVVIFSEQEAETLNLPIDHDDSHAASYGGSFALLIHGMQPAGSDAGKALRQLNGKGSYARKVKV